MEFELTAIEPETAHKIPTQKVDANGKPRGKHYVEPRGYAALPGTGPKDKTCRDCAHYVIIRRSKTYPKCAANRARWTGGRGSDIRVSSPACSRFEQGQR